MYAFIDQPVERLGKGSRFLLWAMRAWVNAARLGTCPRVSVAGAFVNMGAAAAVRDFHGSMARLAAAPGTRIAFAPLSCRRIAEGEAVLLSIWAMLVEGRHEAALGVLRLMVPAGTADLLLESMAAATDHLCHAQLPPGGLHDTMASSDGGGNE